MEFLGDSVLAFVVSQELYQRFPEYKEGELSKLRAHLVSTRHLLRPARQLHIGDHLRLGRGEEKSGGRTKSALLVNALEAIIASLYLDAGLKTVHDFILRVILEPELEELRRRHGEKLPVTDYKSALQEAVHSSGRQQPRYVLVKEEGPEHRKIFTIEAHVSGSATGEEGFVSSAQGSTKKQAEQWAARRAWEYLESLKQGPAAEASDPGRQSPDQLITHE